MLKSQSNKLQQFIEDDYGKYRMDGMNYWNLLSTVHLNANQLSEIPIILC